MEDAIPLMPTVQSTKGKVTKACIRLGQIRIIVQDDIVPAEEDIHQLHERFALEREAL